MNDWNHYSNWTTEELHNYLRGMAEDSEHIQHNQDEIDRYREETEDIQAELARRSELGVPVDLPVVELHPFLFASEDEDDDLDYCACGMGLTANGDCPSCDLYQ